MTMLKLFTMLATASALAVGCGGGQESPQTPGDEERGPVENAGEEVDSTAEDVGEAVGDGADEAGDAVEEAGDEVDEEM